MKLARPPLAFFFAVLTATSVAAADYFPPRGSWDRKTPAELGIGPVNPGYGFANWYLNAGGKPLTKAPASAVRFVGNGANFFYIDWDSDLVVVVRWIKDEAALNEFLGRVLGAMGAPSSQECDDGP